MSHEIAQEYLVRRARLHRPGGKGIALPARELAGFGIRGRARDGKAQQPALELEQCRGIERLDVLGVGDGAREIGEIAVAIGA